MKLKAETVEELSQRLNIPLDGLEGKLESMVHKGQIHAIDTRSSGRKYGLMPFAVGIYEDQLNRMDPEFAQLVEDYFNGFEKNNLFDTEPAIFKVIPINEVIQSDLAIHPYQQVKHIINQAKSWGIRDCICKEQQELLGNTCNFPKSVCLNFSPKENAFENHPISSPITKERAFEILQESEEAGLVHCSMNVQSNHTYICNCCTCCCGVLRAVSERHHPHAYVKSDYQIAVDEELCAGCGTCVDRCQFDALEVVNDLCTIDLDRCIGCGVCAITCPEDALSLISRASEEQTQPPESFRDWMTKKAISRQVDPSNLL
jgi:ferredoxin